jgi:hypothetical protein
MKPTTLTSIVLRSLLAAGALAVASPAAAGETLATQLSRLQTVVQETGDAKAPSVQERRTVTDFTYPPEDPPRFDCYCDPLDPEDPGSCTCEGLIDCIGMLVSNSCAGQLDCDDYGCGCEYANCNP